MAAHRRWLQFSLRGFLVVLTAGCLFSGWAVDRAQKQRAAVEAIEAVGGVVLYDWQGDIASWESSREESKYSPWGPSPAMRFVPVDAEPSAPPWLRQFLGDDLFQHVDGVIFRTRHTSYSKHPTTGILSASSVKPDEDQTAAIEAVSLHLHNLADLRAIYLQGTEKTISKATEERLVRMFPQCAVIREAVVTAIP
jgi:hypothetical protein